MDALEKIRLFDLRVASNDVRLLEETKANGVFDSLRYALRRRGKGSMHGKPKRLFFSLLRARVSKPVTPAVRACLKKKDSEPELHFFVAEGIGMLFADGELCLFGYAKQMMGTKEPTQQPVVTILRPRVGADDPLEEFARDLDQSPEYVVDLLRASGLFDLFERAVRRLSPGGVPRRMDRHFAALIRMRELREMPYVLQARFGAEYWKALHYYVAQGIGIVVVGGEIKDFVVAKEVQGTTKRLSPSTRRWREGKRPRDPGDAFRGPNDPVRVGSSIAAFEGHLSDELRRLQGRRG